MLPRSGGLGKYRGETSYRSARTIRASACDVADVVVSATGRPSRSAAGTRLASTILLTAPSELTVKSGSSTRSAAWRRYSTDEIGEMSSSPSSNSRFNSVGVPLVRSMSTTAPSCTSP